MVQYFRTGGWLPLLITAVLCMTAPTNETGGSSYSISEFKACSLLTSDEIREIVGVTVGKGTEDSMMANSKQCSWAGEEDEGLSPLVSFQWGDNPKDICAKRWQGEKDLASRPDQKARGLRMEDLSGFGDKAWWSFRETQKIVGLTVCSPKGVLRVSLWGSGKETDLKKMTEALARKAYTRL